MAQLIEVKGFKELISTMEKYPVELVKTTAVGMSASLNILWENVPPYPAQDPQARYQRTGLLGRSLGSDQSGGATGQPSVYSIRQLGGGNFEGTFGTSLDYAHWVIGENQAGMHASNWWNIITIAQRSADRIEKLWIAVGEKLAAFLERKGTS